VAVGSSGRSCWLAARGRQQRHRRDVTQQFWLRGIASNDISKRTKRHFEEETWSWRTSWSIDHTLGWIQWVRRQRRTIWTIPIRSDVNHMVSGTCCWLVSSKPRFRGRRRLLRPGQRGGLASIGAARSKDCPNWINKCTYEKLLFLLPYVFTRVKGRKRVCMLDSGRFFVHVSHTCGCYECSEGNSLERKCSTRKRKSTLEDNIPLKDLQLVSNIMCAVLSRCFANVQNCLTSVTLVVCNI